tara:strand:+ start:392 stop:655 length:264 start_codon:yes stop_codon:yes gene_type:complete
MKYRIFLFSILMSTAVVLLSYDIQFLFEPFPVKFFNKDLELTSQTVISLIAFLTVLLVVFLGLLDKIISTIFKADNKEKKQVLDKKE